MRLALPALVPPALALVAGAASAQLSVHTLDDDGPADFSDLQIAIDAAQSGDLILVRPGSYHGPPGPFLFDPAEVSGKSLTIAADGTGTVLLLEALVVRDLAPGQTVVLRGLAFEADGTVGLIADDNLGAVWVEDCSFPAFSGVLPSGTARATVTDSVAVHFDRCQLLGDTAVFKGLVSGPGVTVTTSNVSIYDSQVSGGDASALFGSPAPALHVFSGEVFASGTSFVGGDAVVSGACGAPAVRVFPGGELFTLDVTLTPGAGPGCPSPPPDVDVLGGTWTELTGRKRSLTTPSPVREGEQATLHFEGRNGDAVFLHFAPGSGYLLFPTLLKGAFQLAPLPAQNFFIGVMDPSGVIDLPVVIAELGPGIEGARLPLQASFLSGGLELFLSGGSAIVLLDSSIP